jgi:site-specific DNA recombinase
MRNAGRREGALEVTALRNIRCAIYTRVSSDEGLDQQFNSLHAQQESCAAYIASQRHEGWQVAAGHYEDAGYSGGSMDRSGLKRLLADVEARLIDVVVVYKVDRLSRSLLDFTKIIELFDRCGVSFVSVTQHFNTRSSMGRLTLNVLLSFAQFEREVIGERIRDKIAASKKKGIWMGGMPPLGYDVRDRKLVVNAEEADLVRNIFRRFVALRSGTLLVKELAAEGRRTKAWKTQGGRERRGQPFGKGAIYKLLHNRTYLGEVSHRGQIHRGEQDAIVPHALWEEAHAIIAESPHGRSNRTRAITPAPLRGVIRCAAHGCAMAPTFTKKKHRKYRYYLCTYASAHGYDSCPNPSLNAGEIERAVLHQLRSIFVSPEVLAKSFRAARSRQTSEIRRLQAERAALDARRQELTEAAQRTLTTGGRGRSPALQRINDDLDALEERLSQICAELDALGSIDISERDLAAAFRQVAAIWDQLFPVEQERVVRILIEEIRVGLDSLEIEFKQNGLAELAAELVEAAGQGA